MAFLGSYKYFSPQHSGAQSGR